ncbi:MAG: glycerol kinase, partial [Candidatus Marinimicrobia bacterium]|nr:glycerol kinase [Candidatus Neomarinimicrobiota bacterium]
MTKQYILSIDQGTTGTTVLLINHDGQIIQKSYREIQQIYPKAGWVEHCALDIWESVKFCIHDCVKQANIEFLQIAGIGITNQRETTILWDKNTGEPVHNAIVWQCRRTAPMCEKLENNNFDKIVREKTGLVLDAYFSGTKIAWMLENVSGLRKRAENGEILFGTVDSWLIWKLTGAHITDFSNASRTLIYNIFEKKWDNEL